METPFSKKSDNYTHDTIMPFGPFRGKAIGDVPASYLIALLPNLKDRPDKRLENYIRENMAILESRLK